MALLALYIDNVRDELFRTAFINFRSTKPDGSRHALQSHFIDNVRFPLLED